MNYTINMTNIRVMYIYIILLNDIFVYICTRFNLKTLLLYQAHKFINITVMIMMVVLVVSTRRICNL